jgi:sn-glycerol 3-phosphate transport system ATP-binding protein
MATLVLEHLRKSFGTTLVLPGIDLALASAEMLVIVGASGCGKSTLLRLVAGLEVPTAGRIVLDGRDVTHVDPAARDIAMVFQNYALYPHMTAFDNMAYGLRIRGLSRDEIRRRVEEAAGLLGLGPLLQRKPRQLSGGQRQRVAMGRAIVREPKLFLFDEPLSNLDAKLRVTMRAEIRRLQRRMGVTSLYVTHDQVEAMTLGDRLLVLHQGRPVQLATPMQVFERPADSYVAGFIGTPAMNFLPAVLSHGGTATRLDIGLLIPFADGRPAGGRGRAKADHRHPARTPAPQSGRAAVADRPDRAAGIGDGGNRPAVERRVAVGESGRRGAAGRDHARRHSGRADACVRCRNRPASRSPGRMKPRLG